MQCMIVAVDSTDSVSTQFTSIGFSMHINHCTSTDQDIQLHAGPVACKVALNNSAITVTLTACIYTVV